MPGFKETSEEENNFPMSSPVLIEGHKGLVHSATEKESQTKGEVNNTPYI
jgi:hypothetical protein